MTAPLGRRGLPPDENHPEAPARARRMAPDLELPIRDVPRRGIAEGLTGEDPEQPAAPKAWISLVALGAIIALVVLALWLIFGTRDDGATTAPLPDPSISPGAIATPGETTTPPAPPTATEPEDEPESETSPSQPGTETPPTPPETDIALVPVTIDDGVTLLMPGSWELYADEIVQNERRLVRLRETDTDVRIQAVSLTTVTSPLDEACLELVADHRQSYTDVAEGLPVAVPISGEGEGRSCNFTGTRVSDDVAATVEFTLLQLGDSTLVFRDTIPATVADGSPVLAELVAMECGAAADFGVAINQCAITPDQGDG